MTTRAAENEGQRKALIRFIEGHELPMVVSITKGGIRSYKQNNLSFQWYNDIARQTDGWTPTDARAYCKLHFGVPIMRDECHKFRDQYDKMIKPLLYPDKIMLMVEPIDLPVTSKMTAKQMNRYIETVWQHFVEKGFELTDPEDLLWKDA